MMRIASPGTSTCSWRPRGVLAPGARLASGIISSCHAQLLGSREGRQYEAVKSSSQATASTSLSFFDREISSRFGLRSYCTSTAAPHPHRAIHSGRVSMSLTEKAGATKDKDTRLKTHQQMELPGQEHAMDPRPSFIRKDYKPADKLKGKFALITGGDSGIGRAVALHFTLEGATVAFTYVPGAEDKDAEETVNLLKEAKGKSSSGSTAEDRNPIAIPVDIGFDQNCKKVIDQVVDAFGRIDILVNNAAEQHSVEKIEDMDPEQIERTFRTNILSMFFLVKHAVKHMPDGSSIINTTSVNAYKGNAHLLDYTSTKGAIVAFTRGLALQLMPRSIRVNGVAPGPVWTPLIPASMEAEKVENFGQQCPMGRAGAPHEIAPAYVFLASQDATFFSGQVLHPNGGVVVNA